MSDQQQVAAEKKAKRKRRPKKKRPKPAIPLLPRERDDALDYNSLYI